MENDNVLISTKALVDAEKILLNYEVKNKALEFMAKDLIKIYYGALFNVDYIVTKYEKQAREELMKEKFVEKKRGDI